MERPLEMSFTGERYVPNLDWPELSYEHWHRYLYAAPLAKGKIVLDIACGEGYGCSFLADLAKEVVGVDASADVIKAASRKYIKPNLAFLCGSAESMPIEGEHLFDVVVSFETVEHLQEAAQSEFANEIKRLLKPDGILLISTPNKLLYSDKNSYRNEYHRREFYLDEFVEWLRKRFRFVQIQGQKVYPVSYIWPLSTTAQEFSEKQLEFSDREYVPVNTDKKQVLYTLALCSNLELPPSGASVLIDISERAIQQRIEQMLEQEAKALQLADQVAEMKLQLDAIYASKWWKIVSAYRRLLRRLRPFDAD